MKLKTRSKKEHEEIFLEKLGIFFRLEKKKLYSLGKIFYLLENS